MSLMLSTLWACLRVQFLGQEQNQLSSNKGLHAEKLAHFPPQTSELWRGNSYTEIEIVFGIVPIRNHPEREEIHLLQSRMVKQISWILSRLIYFVQIPAHRSPEMGASQQESPCVAWLFSSAVFKYAPSNSCVLLLESFGPTNAILDLKDETDGGGYCTVF
ncbi:hypothetical protein EDB89DRAFT_220698 [Lactarius sanguifluus]|nr:hypothetical protein EDB89DRAFT_220698 [Lactarius sanguifluus]